MQMLSVFATCLTSENILIYVNQVPGQKFSGIFFRENSFHRPRMNADESAVCVHLRFTICKYLKTLWPITYHTKPVIINYYRL